METSLKAGFAQIFSCHPKNLSSPKFGGAAAPLAPPWSVRTTGWDFFGSLHIVFKLVNIATSKSIFYCEID